MGRRSVRTAVRLGRALRVSVIVLCLAGGLAEGGLRVVRHWIMGTYGLDRAFTRRAACKLLFVGDSFTAGGGTDSGRGFPAYIAERLAGRRAPDGGGVEVVNIALSGTDTGLQLGRMRAYLARHAIAPDVILVVTGANNRNNNESRARYLRERRGEVHAGPWTVIVHRSLLLTVVKEMVGKRLPFLFRGCERPFETGDFFRYVDTRFREDLDAMIDAAQAAGARIAFGTYIRPTPKDEALLRTLRAVLARRGVPLLNLYSEERDRRFLEGGLYARDGWHPNDEGQRLLAELFLAGMARAGLLGAPDRAGARGCGAVGAPRATSNRSAAKPSAAR